jgi:putative ABC transport system permease protein
MSRTGTRGSVAERVGVWLYRRWLLVLPSRLRRRMGDGMVEVFRSRHRSVRWWQVPGAWLHEFGGVVAAAAAARVASRREAAAVRGAAEARDGMKFRRRGPMDMLLQDVRYAWRSLLRRPATTTLALLTFGLGIAASTAMFSVVYAVLLKPLPYPASESIVSVYTTNAEFAGHPTLGFAAERGSFSHPELRALRENGGDMLEGLAFVLSGGAVLYDGEEPERIALGYTDVDLFGRILRVSPLHGRTFDEEDARADARVILLMEDFWRSRYGADPGVVGGTMRLADVPYTIIGVLPQRAAPVGYDVAGWQLITPEENWGNHWTHLIGRLRSGVTPEQASARLSAVLAGALPADHGAHGVNVLPRLAEETRGVRGALWLLALASVLLLAVACGNVAALLVGTAIDRQQELAVRAALGAERGRLIRQLLTESAVLGGGAALIGVLLAAGATRALVLLAPAGVPRIAEATIDARALAFAVVVALGCGVLFGLVPALGYSRTDLRRSMGNATRGSTGDRGRVQGIVVVAELALATVLLVGAGLLARTVLALNAVDVGFAASETLAFGLSIPTSRLIEQDASDSTRLAAVDAFYRRALEEMDALPGVRGVAITSNLPLSPDRGNNDVQLEGYDAAIVAERRFVSPNYFDVLGIRIVEGRAFTDGEDRPDAAGTIVISEGLARRAWPNESALGKRVTYWGGETTVVGVAADVRDESVESGTTYAFYVPRRQAGQLSGRFVVRADVDPVSLVPAIRGRARAVHSGVAVLNVQPLTELVADEIAGQRYRARLIFVFATLAAIFSLMGVYGVTARNVAARTRELGIRMALGARRDGILGIVLGQALRLAALGAVLGIVASFAATRGIEAYLFGVERTDPVTLVTIALLIGGASVLAALAPGLRAARVDPMRALRSE